jgi:hypothetical protein
MSVPVPSRIKVGVLGYTIKPTRHLAVRARDAVKIKVLVDAATDAAGIYHEDTPIEILGLTNPDEQVILFESVDAAPDVQAVVVLHETLHAIFSQIGIRDLLDQHAEESITKRLSPLLLQVLRENPRLIEYLVDRRVGGKGYTR